jgi:hypothetical protein
VLTVVSLNLPRSIRALTGLVLVLAVLAALGGSSAHPGQSCLVHRDCLACRWSADSVVVLSDPPALPLPECVATLASASDDTAAPVSLPSASSRGPPLA